MTAPENPDDKTGGMATLAAAEKIAANLPGLLLEAEKVAHTFMRGLHGRRRVGQGEAFWQFRQYQPGDQRRDIDWRQSAKRDETYVRQTEWEASQTAWLYRDASESMNYRGYKNLPLKKDFAETLLLALAIVILNGGEQVSLLGTDLAPQTTYGAVQRIFETLPAQKKLFQAGRPVASRSEIALFSDFYMPLEEISGFCESLARRGCRGTLVQVCCPSEKTLPFTGRMKFFDIEDPGAEPVILPQVEAVREEYEKKFQEHRDKLAALAASWGWRFLPVETSERPEDVLTKLYDGMAVKK
jgi:uncharacterized protein (DUF58 family)